MRPLPISITSLLFIAIGLASLGALIVPATQPYMQPAWAVVLAAANLIVTGIGFWTMRRWAPMLFAQMWALQALLVTLTNGVVSHLSVVGLVLVSALFAVYRRRFV
jgi:hypothetical protein